MTEERLMTIKRRVRKNKTLLERRSGSGKIVFGITFVLFLVYALSILYPLFWMLVNSFRETIDYNIAIVTKNTFSFKGMVATLTNYSQMFDVITNANASLAIMMVNSLWITGVSSLLSVICPTITAYCMAKYNFKLRGVLYAIAIITMMLPIVGTGGAAIKFWADVGLFDTPFYVIVSNLGGLGGMLFLVMYGFFRSVHWSYAEAVFIDGGNDFTALFRVMLPQAFSMMSLFFIINFMGNWNAYENLLIYMPSYPTLATGIFLVTNTLERTGQMPVYYAALVISTVPIIVLFILFSNKILTQVTIGGLKG